MGLGLGPMLADTNWGELRVEEEGVGAMWPALSSHSTASLTLPPLLLLSPVPSSSTWL